MTDYTKKPKPADDDYKSTPEDRMRARILGIVYVILAIFLAWMLFKIWPPTPWPTDRALDENPQLAKNLADCTCPTPTPTPTPAPAASPITNATPTPSARPTAANSPTAGAAANTPPRGNAGAASPTPTPTPTPSPSPVTSDTLVNVPINFFWGYWCYRTSFDERLILLVIVAGILGSFVHGATSLADFIGNNKFNKTWTWFYLLRPPIGMALALVFYFVIRGGFLTTSGGAKDINPYGIAALAGLVGMFSKQATDKLSEVFSTLFRAAAGEGDDKRSGSLKTDDDTKGATAASTGSLAITDISQAFGPAAGGQEATITGTGFSVDPQPTVTFGGMGAEIQKIEATKIVVVTPQHDPGTVIVVVTNPDGTEAVKTDGYTFQ